jgi:RNA polymerase sigma-70 factor (ECF subfamily)
LSTCISGSSGFTSGEHGVDRLLCGARDGDPQQLGRLLTLYRNYLTILAATQLDARLRRRVSPSDVVQEAMLGAYRDFPKFRGSSERELLAWLRQILINCLHHAYDAHVQAGRRDVRREISLDDMNGAMDRSVARLAHVIADKGPSPSAPAHERERSVAIADQLAKLKPDDRDVIVLRNLQGLSFEEVADRMGRRPGAVRMLWLRAIERFRHVYEEAE